MMKSRYEVREDTSNKLLGTFEELDLVFAFICGYKKQYYNEPIGLVIIEIMEER